MPAIFNPTFIPHPPSKRKTPTVAKIKTTLSSLTADAQALHELLAEQAELHEGDITDVDPILDKWFAELSGNIDDKMDGYAYVMANLAADAETLKAEEDRIAKRRYALQNAKTRMSRRLCDWMRENKIEKRKTLKHGFTVVQGRERVEMTVEAADLPAAYRIVSIEADKKGILEDLKKGAEIPGCSIERGDPYLLVR